MISLIPSFGHDRLRVLCLGAHSDDIEIGCAGTLVRWLDEYKHVDVLWGVFAAGGDRAAETRSSAGALLRTAASYDVAVGNLTDSRFPSQFADAKEFANKLRSRFAPDIILTHRLQDRHQDHRLVAELTWQTWRDHLVLEYEIPKYEGDLGQPTLFVPLDDQHRERKLNHLRQHFPSQRTKDWFGDDTFNALMRLRGVECRSPSGYAEAFYARKVIL